MPVEWQEQGGLGQSHLSVISRPKQIVLRFCPMFLGVGARLRPGSWQT